MLLIKLKFIDLSTKKHNGMIDIFQNLNDNQKEAVRATEGLVRVNAGAGSGKTKTLACRYAYLVNEIGIDPAHILCLTFTNKAAKEMAMRIAKMVNVGHINDYVSTIHGFCVKVLRKDIYRLGYPKTFTILDQDDSKMLAQQVMKELNITREETTIKDFLRDIAQFKSYSHGLYIKLYMLPNSTESEEAKKMIPKRVRSYIQKQVKYFSLDFDDLIYFTLYIFTHFEEARQFWQNEISYLMVDEAQDCNKSDWCIINILSDKYHNLYIVGDADQAIYEWRGAKPQLFVEFKPEKDITLNENYRSTSNILNTANSIIENNEMRLPKNLFTQKEGGTQVVHFHGKNENEEADWVKLQIKNRVDNGARPSDFAILYRASYLSRFIEQALVAGQIKYTVWGGIRFFERKEIKDSLSYLRLVDHDDDLAFLRIVNVPSRKIGKVYLANLQKLADTEMVPLYQAMKNHIYESEYYKPLAVDFIKAIEESRNMIPNSNIVEILDNVMKKSGYLENLRTDGDQDRLENIEELINSIKYYQEINREEDISLNKYLQDISLYTNADYKNDIESVKLMTIHQAKGLEFPYVFVIGLTEGIFPSYKTLRERKQNGLEEERRLMYVAVTRAEKYLYLTESEGYNYTTHQEKYPSRFLTEIKKDFFVTEGKMDETLWDKTKNMVDNLDEELKHPEIASTDLKLGDHVNHKIFGEGVITEVDSVKKSCTVMFGEQRRFIRFAFLSKITNRQGVTFISKDDKSSIFQSNKNKELSSNNKIYKNLIEYIKEPDFNKVTEKIQKIKDFYNELLKDKKFIASVDNKVVFNLNINDNYLHGIDIKVKSMLIVDVLKAYLECGYPIDIHCSKGIILLQLMNMVWSDNSPIEYQQLDLFNETATSLENLMMQIKNGLIQMNLNKETFFVSEIISSYDKDSQIKYLWLLFDFVDAITFIGKDYGLNEIEWKEYFEEYITKLSK